MKFWLSERAERLSGKPWPLLKWQPAAGKGGWVEKKNGDLWSCWPKWKLTLDWPLPIECWPPGQHGKISSGAGVSACSREVKKCVQPSILMEMIQRYQLSGQKDACVHKGNGCLAPTHWAGRSLTTSDRFCPIHETYGCPGNLMISAMLF